MLFNYILSVEYITVMNDGVIVNDVLVKIWRAVVMNINTTQNREKVCSQTQLNHWGVFNECDGKQLHVSTCVGHHQVVYGT